MKKILAVLMALMLSMSLAVFADEPVVEESAEQAPVVDDSKYNEESIKQYIVFTFDKDDSINYKGVITADEGTLEYLKATQPSVTDTEFDGQKGIVMNEQALEMAQLTQGFAVDRMTDDGIFGTKTTYMYVDLIGTTATEGEEVLNLVFEMNSKPFGAKNIKIEKNTAIKTIMGGEENAFVFSTYQFKLIPVLIAVMVLVIIILVILLAVLSKKKKKLGDIESLVDAEIDALADAEGIDVVENIVEESIDEALEEVIEPIEEVAEEAVEEVAEEITEEDKTEE